MVTPQWMQGAVIDSLIAVTLDATGDEVGGMNSLAAGSKSIEGIEGEESPSIEGEAVLNEEASASS